MAELKIKFNEKKERKISITYIKNNISIRTSQCCSEFSIYRITKIRLKITLYEKYLQICGYQSVTGFRIKGLALKAPIYCNCSRVVLKNVKPQSLLGYCYFTSLCASASTLVIRVLCQAQANRVRIAEETYRLVT